MKGTGKRTPARERGLRRTLAKEIGGVLLLGAGVFLILSLASYSPETDPGFFHKVSAKPASVRNLGGPIGSYVASLLSETMGRVAYLLPVVILLGAGFLVAGIPVNVVPWKVPAGILFLVSASALFALVLPDRASHLAGGSLGKHLGKLISTYLHHSGAYLTLTTALLASAMVVLQVSLLDTGRRLIKGALWLFTRATTLILAFFGGRERISKVGKVLSVPLFRLWRALKALVEKTSHWIKRAGAVARRRVSSPPAPQPIIMDHSYKPSPPPSEEKEESLADIGPSVTPFPDDQAEAEAEEETEQPPEKTRERPRLVQTAFPFTDQLGTPYRTPPLDLLDDPDPSQTSLDHKDLLENAKIMEHKLLDFGVEGKVTEVHPGPIITLFEYEPAPGVKVNRIVNLADDLAMALKALSVRIVAPIPGKAVVGIEVPNPVRQKVCLKEILASESFKSTGAKLPLALGKDIAGRPVTTDLSRMPHLLIAGATGTGKSVCLHTLILSLLFRFSPQEIKFLMIDPKMLELTSYQGIPHLLHPVITEARRASDALEWAVERMEQRYQLLSEKGVRNIENYNARLEKEPGGPAAAGHTLPTLSEPDEKEFADKDDGYVMPEQGPLPYIVIVIDEMSDLMIISGRQVEEAITRLAQMARAAGIHLLLATQRPSVDVLTGIIKANLPTRISFQVSSRIDSRTILDNIGAEKLLGQGDMLFLPPGTSKVRRIHGAYVSESEIERIGEFLKRYGKPRYEKIPFHTKKPKEKDEAEFQYDEKYDEAVQLVAESGQASISMIQRRLRVGYNRAARMIEKMEQEGIVGPQEGVKPREVLIHKF